MLHDVSQEEFHGDEVRCPFHETVHGKAQGRAHARSQAETIFALRGRVCLGGAKPPGIRTKREVVAKEHDWRSEHADLQS